MSDLNYFIDTICSDVSCFDSGHAVFNDYLHDNDDSAVMHYIIDAESEKLIAYFSLLSSAALYGEIIRLGAIPAIELKMFAMDKHYQKRGVAHGLLESVLKVIEQYSAERVGAKIILLYSVPIDAVTSLYKKCGFQLCDGLLVTYKSPFNEGCIPMYKVL